MWCLILASLASAATPADDAYLTGLDAWNRRDWDEALLGAQAALALDPAHPAARLLEASVLVQRGRLDEGIGLLEVLATDGEVKRDAPRIAEVADVMVRRYADRWKRDDVAISGGPLWRQERASEAAVWGGGIGVEVWVPVRERLGVRFDATTPLSAYDTLAITGPIWSVLGVVQQPIGSGIWHLDLGLGPSAWTGVSQFWDDRYAGVFPGARAALGLDVRAWQYVGFRVEAGYAAHHGARPGLPYWSDGFDLRVLTTGYPR